MNKGVPFTTVNLSQSLIEAAKKLLLEPTAEEKKKKVEEEPVDESKGRVKTKSGRNQWTGRTGYEDKDDYKWVEKYAKRQKRISDKRRKKYDKLWNEETLVETATRKHFQAAADTIKKTTNPKDRMAEAKKHADIFAKLNPGFDHARFYKAAGITEEIVNERWGKKVDLNPKKKGMFKGKGKEEIKKNLEGLKKTGPHPKGSEAYTKEKEDSFAIRAKSGWKK